jgi:hypothetical protein
VDSSKGETLGSTAGKTKLERVRNETNKKIKTGFKDNALTDKLVTD